MNLRQISKFLLFFILDFRLSANNADSGAGRITQYPVKFAQIRAENRTVLKLCRNAVKSQSFCSFGNLFDLFFENIPKIARKMKTLCDVGLGYVKLGQSATTLSGGEAQRVKLATELSKRATGRTIYILDEPTTGLHAADVHKLIEVLQTLVDSGNTVVVIEHNLDVIKTADYIIDLGPEGGDRGGEIIVTGTPEQVAECEGSYTGKYLKKVLLKG